MPRPAVVAALTALPLLALLGFTAGGGGLQPYLQRLSPDALRRGLLERGGADTGDVALAAAGGGWRAAGKWCRCRLLHTN